MHTIKQPRPRSLRATGGERSTHGALVLYKHAYAMRPMLGQLLHNLGKVDRGEEVAPREVCQQVDLLLVFLSVREGGRPHDRLPRRALHVLVNAAGFGPPREPRAVPEEAGKVSVNR